MPVRAAGSSQVGVRRGDAAPLTPGWAAGSSQVGHRRAGVAPPTPMWAASRAPVERRLRGLWRPARGSAGWRSAGPGHGPPLVGAAQTPPGAEGAGWVRIEPGWQGTCQYEARATAGQWARATGGQWARAVARRGAQTATRRDVWATRGAEAVTRMTATKQVSRGAQAVTRMTATKQVPRTAGHRWTARPRTEHRARAATTARAVCQRHPADVRGAPAASRGAARTAAMALAKAASTAAASHRRS